MKRKLISLVGATAAILLVARPALAAPETDPAAVAADALVGRPLCFAATVIGSAIFVVTLPVAATSHSVHSTAESLVLTPARATFTRPLGDFDIYTPDSAMARRQPKSAKRNRVVSKVKPAREQRTAAGIGG